MELPQISEGLPFPLDNDAIIQIQNIICDKLEVQSMSCTKLFWWNDTLLQYDVPVECSLSGGDNGERFLQDEQLDLASPDISISAKLRTFARR